MTNAEIADRLMSLAQLLSAQKENAFKVKAYRRAAKMIATLAESLEDMVRNDADLTEYAGIGKGISGAVREIVDTGTLRQLEALRAEVSPEVAAINEYPRLDPARVLRIYKKLRISSVENLKEKLSSGEIREAFGARMDAHVRHALVESHEMLLYDADPVVAGIEEFLLSQCGAARAEAVGDYRRRTATVSDLRILLTSENFPDLLTAFERYGGGTDRVSSSHTSAAYSLSSGILLQLQMGRQNKWGIDMIRATGSDNHLKVLEALPPALSDLARSKKPFTDEASVYSELGLRFIEPELREGRNELELAAAATQAGLITTKDIRGDLHAHTTSSDGVNTIEEMARAARKRGYEYVGITDHSRSLKIAGGLSEDDLWKQIRYIDKLNEKSGAFRILKSAEVDILADGTLDYSDELLKELDYTVCSVHSRFSFGKAEQTERILRAMDNRYFTILGHATGRLLLKRPGYEIDIERIAAHAKANGCFFEINSSPDRLDLSDVNARIVAGAGVPIAVSTDAHSIREYDLIRCGIDQARRAGLDRNLVLNSRKWVELERICRR